MPRHSDDLGECESDVKSCLSTFLANFQNLNMSVDPRPWYTLWYAYGIPCGMPIVYLVVCLWYTLWYAYGILCGMPMVYLVACLWYTLWYAYGIPCGMPMVSIVVGVWYSSW